MANNNTAHDYVGEVKPTSKKSQNPALLILKPLASLRVTIALFVLSLILVFMGTLAQKHSGIERVLREYFYCWVATIDLNLISDFTEVFFKFRFAGDLKKPFVVPVWFPGGYLIGWAMVVNLTAAHIVRFRMAWSQAGIWILHFGMVVLLAGEFVKAEIGHEDRMNLREGQTSDFLIDTRKFELTIAKHGTGETVDVIKIPHELLQKSAQGVRANKPSARIDLPDVPFYVKTLEYYENSSDPRARSADEEPQTTNGLGKFVTIKSVKEFSGTDPSGRADFASAVVEFFRKDNDASLGTYLVSELLGEAQSLAMDDKIYHVNFRMQRTYLPYSITAEKIENDFYPGTEIPRNYASTIRLQDPRNKEDRTVTIWMNHPLRYDGATYYQSQMEAKPGSVKVTGLQVVRNPGSSWPYVSCTLVSLGMLVHFGVKFLEFLKKKAAAEQRAAMNAAKA